MTPKSGNDPSRVRDAEIDFCETAPRNTSVATMFATGDSSERSRTFSTGLPHGAMSGLSLAGTARARRSKNRDEGSHQPSVS